MHQEHKNTITQNKHQKTKARFSCLLRHPAWKWRGPVLISALYNFGTYLLTYTLTHLLTAPVPTRGKKAGNQCFMFTRSPTVNDH